MGKPLPNFGAMGGTERAKSNNLRIFFKDILVGVLVFHKKGGGGNLKSGGGKKGRNPFFFHKPLFFFFPFRGGFFLNSSGRGFCVSGG